MSTKIRRPVALATPSKAKSSTAAHKQAVLDNFDLEVSHRTRAMRAHLASALASFLSLADSELVRLPLDMRALTLGELEAVWAGGLGETARRIAQRRFERAHPDVDEAQVRADAAAGKRKRGAQTPLLDSPGRSTKNARTQKPAPLAAGPNSRARKTPTSKRTKQAGPAASVAPSPAYSSRSGLPQDHIFNPLLPNTPRHPRPPRRNESILSLNGSPLALVSSDAGGSNGAEGVDGADDDDDEDDTALPNPEALEAHALGRAALGTGKAPSKPAAARAALGLAASVGPGATAGTAGKRRKPSLMFRQSLAPVHRPATDGNEEVDSAGDALSEIALSDGRVLAFNPLNLSPGRIGVELDAGGLGAKEKETVLRKVRDEAVRALSARMEKWHV
ncbi:hypothetical protein Q5752_002540 [Cryptotrichosporon argae]